MSINPVAHSPVNPAQIQERVAAEHKTPAEEHARPQDMVDVATRLGADIQAFLAEVEANGVPITPLTEGNARDAAEAAREALGNLSLSIANANPGALSGFLGEGD
jgi:hypothetical protein